MPSAVEPVQDDLSTGHRDALVVILFSAATLEVDAHAFQVESDAVVHRTLGTLAGVRTGRSSGRFPGLKK